MPTDDWEELVMKERGRFAGFVHLTTSSVAPKSRMQLFLFTFSARFNGLSRNGIAQMAHHGYLMKLSQMDEYEKRAMRLSETENRHSPKQTHNAPPNTLNLDFVCLGWREKEHTQSGWTTSPN